MSSTEATAQAMGFIRTNNLPKIGTVFVPEIKKGQIDHQCEPLA